MSVLQELRPRGDWAIAPLGGLVDRKQEPGFPELDPLSVYLNIGVVPRSVRDDNHNSLGADMSKYQRVLPGDLVFNKLRTWQGGFGSSQHEGIVSPAYIICRPRQADSRYLNYTLHSEPYLAELTRVSKWMPPSQFDITWSDLKQVPMMVPPIEDQRRIADFLDDRVSRIDNIISARQRQLDLSATSLSSQIVAMLVGPDAEILRSAPWFRRLKRPWPLVKLKTRWSVIDCKHRTPDYVDEGYPVISPGDISKGRLDLNRASRFVGEGDFWDLADPLRRCLSGDIVYSRNASAGSAAYVADSAPFTMGQDVCRITSDGENQLYLSYVLNYLCAPQLDSARVGSTFTRINIDQIKTLVVPTPPPHTQELIGASCDKLVAEATRAGADLNSSIALLAEYKQSLITAAVTGELDVTTASKKVPA